MTMVVVVVITVESRGIGTLESSLSEDVKAEGTDSDVLTEGEDSTMDSEVATRTDSRGVEDTSIGGTGSDKVVVGVSSLTGGGVSITVVVMA